MSHHAARQARHVPWNSNSRTWCMLACCVISAVYVMALLVSEPEVSNVTEGLAQPGSFDSGLVNPPVGAPSGSEGPQESSERVTLGMAEPGVFGPGLDIPFQQTPRSWGSSDGAK